MADLLQFALLGMGAGCVYALVALGVVLVYRASGVLNFANAATGMVTAYVFFDLRDVLNWPWAVALLASLVLGAVLGAATHLLLMRPLQQKSALIRLMMTLAVLLAMQSFAELRWDFETRLVDGVLPKRRITVLPDVEVALDRVLMTGIALALTAVLVVVYHRTRFGLRTSAVAESPRRVDALGHSSDLIATINWSIAGALSTVAAVLAAPLTGLQPSQTSLLIVPALAAALIGGFSSFGLTLLGAMLMGIAESEMARFAVDPEYASTIPFFVIVVVLVVRGRSLPMRGALVDRATRFGSGQFRPVAVAVVVAVTVLLMYTSMTSTWVDALTLTVVGTIFVLSVVVVTGFAGQLSLTQMAIAGMGAWVAARAIAEWGIGFELAFVLAVAAAVPLGFAVGIPALRTRGANLAIATLGLGILLERVIFKNPLLTGGVVGTNIGQVELFGFELQTVLQPRTFALVALAVLVVCTAVVCNLRRSPSGRMLIAVRSGERAAATLGINVTRAKLAAFVLASILAAIGGVLFAYRSPIVNFSTLTSISVVLYAVIGGVGFVSGAVMGGVLLPGGIGEQLTTSLFGHEAVAWTQMIGSLIVVSLLIQMPDGLVPAHVEMFHAARDAIMRRLRPGSRVVASPAATTHDVASVERRAEPRALEIHGMVVRFGGVTAVDGVSLRLEPGEILGVIGPNGAGKTTLIDGITGLVPIDEGRIELGGLSIGRLPAHARSRAGLARSFQSIELFDSLSVLDNVGAGSADDRYRDYGRDIVWPRSIPMSTPERAAIAELGLESVLDRFPGELPHSQRRLVGIARAVATGASVVMLDEPCAGLDADEAAELADLVRRLAKSMGIGVLLVEHNVPFVLDVCDRVLAMNFGARIAVGTPDEVQRSQAVQAAYFGTSRTVVSS